MRRLPLIASVFCALLLFGGLWPPTSAWAAPAKDSLYRYLRSNPELSPRDRKRWAKAVKRRFGGSAIEAADGRPEVEVARRILAAAIEAKVGRKKAAQAAWVGWHDALRFVPPPIAVHYQILGFQNTQPRGRAIDLAFHFPDYFTPEIAPELVAWWEAALESGRLPDDQIEEVKEALAATRDQMRPMLVDKLRLLAALAKERQAAAPVRKAEIERDREELETELYRSFSRVARRPEVLDSKRRPFDRLRLQLEDMGQQLGSEDLGLDPDAPPATPKAAPKPPLPTVAPSSTGPALFEPTQAPLPELPDQARPGGAPGSDPLGRSVAQLKEAYQKRLLAGVEPWLGTPYRYGNATRGVGTDCSGFVRAVYDSTFAVELPRVSRDQARRGHSVRRADLRPGDLVFFDITGQGRVDHVGIFLGSKRFVHATRRGGVMKSKLSGRPYNKSYRGARRLLPYPR